MANSKSSSLKKREKKDNLLTVLTDGIYKHNPIFVQTLGMCSTMAISTSVVNGLGMGLSVTFVLFFSNIVISLLRNFIPNKIRIASYIVVIAGFVTVVEMLIKAYMISLSESMGVFIPLIVVNCIILARAESFASKHGVVASAIDGLGNGIGYTLALLIMSTIREIIGSGTLCGIQVMPEAYSPAGLIVQPVGGFLVLGVLIALFQFVNGKIEARSKEAK